MRSKLFLLLPLIIYLISQSGAKQHKVDCFEEIETLMFYSPQLAECKLDSLIQHTGYKAHANIKFIQGFLLYQKGDIDSSMVYLQDAQRQFSISRNKEGEGKCQFALALIAEGIGQWEQAKINYYSTIKLVSKNQIYNGLSYYGIARCKSYLKEDYGNNLQEGNEIVESLNTNIFNIYSEYLNIILSKSLIKSDQHKLNQIAASYSNFNLNMAAGVYRSIALRYISFGELDSALLSLDKGINICSENYSGISHLPSLFQTKGVVFFKKNELDSAKFYLKKALHYYDEYNLHDRKYFAYTYLRKIAFNAGEYKEAYDLLDKTLKAEKQSKSIIKARTAKLMEISSDQFVIQNELNKQRTLKRFILFLLILFIAISIYIIHINKNKNKRRLEVIKNKNNELNKLMIGINEKILMQKRCGKEFEIKKEQNNLETITDQFDACYRETLNLLLDRYKILSTTECRYALLFGLRYSDDTICSIQSVQKSAVRKARQRIRNKLNFSNEINLNDYFGGEIPNNLATFGYDTTHVWSANQVNKHKI